MHQNHYSLLLLILAGGFVSVSAMAGPLGSSAVDAAASAAQILLDNPATPNGFYWFDPDGAGGDAAFQTYADMASDGGGWMLAVHSINGSESPSTDMVANLGAASMTNGFTRDLSYWAVDQSAQIRHRITDVNGSLLFDGFYTGNYHGVLGLAGAWTILAGNLNASSLNYHLGMDWSTVANDVDDYAQNCAIVYGQPWYHGACWTTLPTGYTYTNGPMGTPTGPYVMLGSYDIYVRELNTPPLPSSGNIPEPATLALLGLGFGGLATIRHRKRKVTCSL